MLRAETSGSTDYQRLLHMAREAMRFSYSPYSKFSVGAAVMSANGQITTGCNIENAAYGSTVCAERVAIWNAVSQGFCRIIAIAVVSGARGVCPPCGSCRQVMYELAKDAQLVMESPDGKVVTKPVTELLPIPFGPEHL